MCPPIKVTWEFDPLGRLVVLSWVSGCSNIGNEDGGTCACQKWRTQDFRLIRADTSQR